MTTSKTSFTPGPWRIEASPSKGRWTAVYTVDPCEDLAQVIGQANAHLIAAAPDLYAALEGMLEAYEDDHGNGVCDCMLEEYNQPHICEACQARQALAKARSQATDN